MYATILADYAASKRGAASPDIKMLADCHYATLQRRRMRLFRRNAGIRQ